MSQLRRPPSWLTHENVPETVRAGRVAGASTDDIVAALAEHVLDADHELIRDLVAGLTPATPGDGGTAAIDTDTDRTPPTRRFAVSDVAYLGRREFARVLGGVLTRYEGRFHLADPGSDLATDLFWRRPHTTVGVRVEPRFGDGPVGTSAVRAVVDGETDPVVGRATTRVAVVSNRPFEPEAATVATDEVELVGPTALRRWFTDARLSRATAGELVEAVGLTDEQFAELLSSTDRVPAVRRPDDPLAVGGDPTCETTGTGTEETAGTRRESESLGWDGLDAADGAVTDTPGECGVVYDRGDELAPEEDDTTVVDDFVGGLGGDDT